MFSLLELSFYLAYFFLAGSTPLTAFELFNYFPDKHEPLKYILAIETTVNIIASFAYSQLFTFIKIPINYSSITNFRYLDWFATTPLLLISFTLYLQYKKNISSNTNNSSIDQNKPTAKFDFNKLGIIILLNLVMLIFGFIGETGRMNHILACIIGFIPFIFMFYLIWQLYGDVMHNKNIFGVFVVVWSLYGLVYFLPNTSKNISYNILDIIAKVGFGLLVWFEVVQLRLTNQMENNQTVSKKCIKCIN